MTSLHRARASVWAGPGSASLLCLFPRDTILPQPVVTYPEDLLSVGSELMITDGTQVLEDHAGCWTGSLVSAPGVGAPLQDSLQYEQQW